jgi:hypothetical protein
MTDLNPLIARLAAIGVKVAATEAPTTLDSLKAALAKVRATKSQFVIAMDAAGTGLIPPEAPGPVTLIDLTGMDQIVELSGPFAYALVEPGVTNLNETSPIAEILNAQNSNPNGQNILGIAGDGTGPGVPDGLLPFSTPPIVAIRVGQRLPVGPGAPIDLGQSEYPGSLAGTNPYNLLPINLNTAFTSGTLLPASYGIPESIEQVITCNCDCWYN